jgi:hypothetical protein
MGPGRRDDAAKTAADEDEVCEDARKALGIARQRLT